ncbi:MAG: sulfate adenylyltransferase subunit CysN [Planctomycetes bacterium]|nr:sulfate adenylyltransferase subunit CysN [Planctomycetota bacterium]
MSEEPRDLVRVATIGSVDDGKSTLIGRLLFETGSVARDHLAAAAEASRKLGRGELDLSLLLDGLVAEREQAITIDVGYRRFATARREYILADTPGHEQYTRNMVTGASTCNLAIILIDARNGISTQTLRHSFITALLGIKHIAVAINKMDLMDFSQEVFNRIRDEYMVFADKLGMKDVQFLPLSALNGDNVVDRSENTPWYDGPALMEYLETVPIAGDRNLDDFRFPVQYVIRPNLDFRGFAGTIASGIVRPGDEVMVLPSRKTTRVKDIVTFDGNLDEAFTPQAPTITLTEEVDVSRGDMIVRKDNLPHVGQDVDAMIVWMAEEPMVPGKSYWIKHTTRLTNALVSTLHYKVDVNTLERGQAPTLALNEIGRCGVTLSEPLCWDPYTKNRNTGAFIVVDKMTNVTVGAGMILDPEVGDPYSEGADLGPAKGAGEASEYRPLTGIERSMRFGQQPLTVLLTGHIGAGKRSIAYGLERKLFEAGRTAFVIDPEKSREGMGKDLGYSSEALDTLVEREAETARLLSGGGLICLLPAVAPSRAARHRVRELVGAERFLEVHVSAAIDVCRERDSSGLYARADSGEIKGLPGVDGPYEAPAEPDLTLAAFDLSLGECVERLYALLEERGFLRASL